MEKIYTVFLGLSVEVEAESEQEASERSWQAAADKLQNRGVGALEIQEVEEEVRA